MWVIEDKHGPWFDTTRATQKRAWDAYYVIRFTQIPAVIKAWKARAVRIEIHEIPAPRKGKAASS